MAVHCLRMLPKQTDKDIMDRKDSIKFKLMPEGHIRGVQTQRTDLASAAEWMIYFTNVCAPTISVAHVPKLLIADDRIFPRLQRRSYKWLGDHARAFDPGKDNAGCSEMMIYLPIAVAPTITVAHAPKLLIADERIYNALRHAVLQGDSR